MPTLADVTWSELVGLLEAVGCTLVPLGGSRYRVRHEATTRRFVIHRPHPRKDCSKGLVEAVREYLEDLDVTLEAV